MRHHVRNCLLVLAAACGASAPPPAKPTHVAATLPALPRSSLAAVLEHRADLGLDDAQVKRLVEMDQELGDANQALRDQAATRHEAKATPAAGAGAGTSGAKLGTGHGRRGGGGMRAAPAGEARRPRTLQDRLDDNDTQAYLRAEQEVLTQEQRPRAREIAEQYREAAYDRRASELVGDE